MKKLCYVATIPAVVHAFLREHIQAASTQYQVTVICNTTEKNLLDGLNARLILLPIERKPAPWKDLLTLYQLYKRFRQGRFDIVHSIMPKTGLLAMLAAWLANTPTRIHTFTGQVWATKHGLRRTIFKLFDKLIVLFSTCALADSPSQQTFLIKEGILPLGKAKVVGAGSICGVDPSRFSPNAGSRLTSRFNLGIDQNSILILFVGRLNKDKGMLDLAAAFATIAKNNPDVELLLVGSEEDVTFSHIQTICKDVRDRLHYLNFTSTPERYMAAADIFCLPSYREGFGLTIIEAAACGLPAIASRIYGITDAIADGKTGILFPAGNVNALTLALQLLITDNTLRQEMGNSARERVLELFSSKKITCEMLELYDKLSNNHPI